QTLLLAHKGVHNQKYNGTGSNDQGWAALGVTWEHKRDPRTFLMDGDKVDASLWFTSPHPNVMPVLFADGSVRGLSYAVAQQRYHAVGTNADYPLVSMLWMYNDRRIIPPYE